jgi:hypothetical protein
VNKPTTHKIWYFTRRQKQVSRIQTIRANKYRHRKRYGKKDGQPEPNPRKQLRLKQVEIAKSIHGQFSYARDSAIVKIEGEFGIEIPADAQQYFDIACQIIDFDKKHLQINMEDATRIWPSALTLLCSMREWVDIGNRYAKINPPHISSTDSKSEKVNFYLDRSGFHNYVGRGNTQAKDQFDSKGIVPIQKEINQNNVEIRENEIVELIENKCSYSSMDIEWFNSIVLSETFLNVSEHGIITSDQGWWILAQHHEKHKFISLCIADNGIGIKNSLLIGPQKDEILKKFDKHSINDGEFIKLALQENISGAYNASLHSEGVFRAKFPRGKSRGNGLKRIVDKCSDLGIRFSILSHYGYVMLDEDGKEIEMGTKPFRIFGGTLYNFIIPTRK